MIDRRGFLASAATFIIAPSLLKPMKVVYKPPTTPIELFKLKASLFYLSPEELMRHQFVLVNKNNSLWKGPKITSADADDNRILLDSEFCLYKERIEYSKIAIFSPDGAFRSESDAKVFFGNINPGDTLRVTYRIFCIV